MGWNSWNQVHCHDLTEQVVRDAADAIVERGLKAAGYEYIVIDDCWQGGRDDGGELFAHPKRFPSGIPALAAYVHGLGLKLGIYGVPGSETCANFYDGYAITSLGSRDNERRDAETFAAWEVDFLKYDWCRADETDGLERTAAFTLMRDQLARVGRPIVYAISEYGEAQPWEWAPSIAQQWRTTQDIQPTWESIAGIIAAQSELAGYAAPGAWNDPDMLQFGNGDLSPEQNRSHFAMWCMLAAPLFLGTDIAALSDDEIAVLTDPGLLAIGQDPLGQQARRTGGADDAQIWVRGLADGDRAVACFNPTSKPSNASITAAAAGVERQGWIVEDLSERTEADLDGAIPIALAAYSTRVFRLRPTRS
jgi:alpha-galactosidase